MLAGIYLIENILNGKVYVGSAIDIASRFANHRAKLRHNKHRNRKLQNAWNKYGEKNFSFSVVEEANIDNLLKREQVWIDSKASVLFGYNICITAGNSLGRRMSIEARQKMSLAKRGKIPSKLDLENLRLGRIIRKQTNGGRPLSPEHREKISIANKGRRFTLGHKLSPEHRSKLSAAGIGRKLSVESCVKISVRSMGNQYALGYKHSPESCAKRWVTRRSKLASQTVVLY